MICEMSQILWRLGQTNIIVAVTVVAAVEVVSVRLGVSSAVFSTRFAP